MKLPRDPASKQAMRYIQLFDEALKKRGVQMLIGTELEFSAVNTSGKDNETFSKELQDAFHHSHAFVREGYKDGANVIHPGLVQRFYSEKPLWQYEITTHQATPLRAAHLIAGQRRAIAESEQRPEFWTRLGMQKPAFRHIDLNPRIKSEFEDMSNGMHINFSFNTVSDTHQHAPLLTIHASQISPMGEKLMQHLRALQPNDVALVLDHPNSFARFKNWQETTSLDVAGVLPKESKEHRGVGYIEYSMPSAWSNPYFSVLMVMAASYDVLKNLPEKKDGIPLTPNQLDAYAATLTHTKKPHISLPLPKSVKEAQDLFISGSGVLQSMHAVALESGIEMKETEADIEIFRKEALKSVNQSLAGVAR